jgi:primase-polymerase (primpol)-like protein
VWKYELRDNEPTKVPYRVDGRGRASATDAATWGSFDAAVSVIGATVDFDGVGFVFSADDPYCGIDLDACGDGSVLAGDAAVVLSQLNSYAEWSPSRTGVHVVLRGRLPGARRRRSGVEMYESRRFFTMTGVHVAGTPTTIEDRQAELEEFYRATFSELLARPQASAGVAHGPVDLDDERLLLRAHTAANGAKFAALWRGDFVDYGSHSEADLALCAMLAFWAGGDVVRIDRLFRRSGLCRPKWERDDYRARTIATALGAAPTSYGGGR